MNTNTTIDPATTIGAVALSVADMRRSFDYYQRVMGLSVLSSNKNSATLGVGTRPLLRLREISGARLVRRATGLYHFALRVPTRRDLARTLRHFAAIGAPIAGAADHRVSEALYMTDPDGHGIEIYRDYPRELWPTAQEGRAKATPPNDPLDLPGIMQELNGDTAPWRGLAAGTDMGHIHLQVANIHAAERFYLDTLGFERIVGTPTASFVSAGGYHHHIGMNTWAGINVAAPPENAARLLSYEVLLPTTEALHDTLERARRANIQLTEAGQGWTVHDPSHNLVLLRSSEALGD